MIHSNDELAAVRKLQQISSELKAECDGGEINISKNGRAFVLYLFPPATASGRGTYIVAPAFIQIKTAIPYQHSSFKIRKTDNFDWIAEHLFFKHDFQTGDKIFDKSFYITVENKAWGDRFFRNNIIMTSISNILSNGFHKIYSEEDYLKIDLFIRTLDECPTVEKINSTIEQLEQIVTNFPTC